MLQEPIVNQQSKEAEADQNLFKVFLVGIAGVFSSAFATRSFLSFLLSITLQNMVVWISLTSLFLIVVLLQVFFIKSLGKLLIILFLEALVPLVFFIPEIFPYPSITLLAGTAFFAAMLVFSSYNAWSLIKESISIRFLSISNSIFTGVTAGLLLFSSVIMYVWYFDLNRFNPQDGYAIMNSSIFSIEPVLKVFIPEVSLNESVDNFFNKLAETQVRKFPQISIPYGGGDVSEKEINFQLLNKKQQEQAIKELGKNLHISFEKTLGPLPNDVLLKDALFSIFSEKIKGFSEKTKSYFGIIVALVLFSLFRGIFFILGYVIRLIAYFLYKILIFFGFAKIGIETRTREFILLP